MKTENATFYAFNPSGKWKYEGRGFLSSSVFDAFTRQERRERILRDNDGKFPGMSTAAEEYIWVVIGDPEIDHGFPLMLHP